MDLLNTIKEWFGISPDNLPDAINPEELQSQASDAVQTATEDVQQRAEDVTSQFPDTK